MSLIRSGWAEELKLGPENSAKGGGRASAIAFPPAKEFRWREMENGERGDGEKRGDCAGAGRVCP